MVVIGAGECGTRAAFALRENGWTGPITLVGGEAEHPYERPPLSKTWTHKPICDDERLRAADVTYLPGTHATALDPHTHAVTLDDGRTLAYAKLLLATGATARPLPFDGAAGAPRPRARRRAGPASARLRAGTRIGGHRRRVHRAGAGRRRGGARRGRHVLELADRLMGRGRARPHRGRRGRPPRRRGGGRPLRHRGPASPAHPGGPWSASPTARRSRWTSWWPGSAPCRDTALAERAGLAVDDGVLVDATLATSAPDVFAAGDCCRFPHPLYPGRPLRLESWRAAQQQGDTAAKSMLGTAEAYTAVPWFWSDQHDLSLQVAGLAAAATDEAVRVRPDGVELWFGLDPEGRLVAAAAVGPGNAVAKDIRLAEMLIAARVVVPADALADPGVALKSLLRRTPAGV